MITYKIANVRGIFYAVVGSDNSERGFQTWGEVMEFLKEKGLI